jgi:pleiotropic regulator 1
MTTLTHHKKGIRSLVAHPRELTFASGAADNIKKWQTRDGVYVHGLLAETAHLHTRQISAKFYWPQRYRKLHEYE